MPTYLLGQKQKYRITLELEVLEDFDPHQIDWEKVLDIQGSEKVSSYVEDLSKPDSW
jgi:predicted component of type VI protein secretion system